MLNRSFSLSVRRPSPHRSVELPFQVRDIQRAYQSINKMHRQFWSSEATPTAFQGLGLAISRRRETGQMRKTYKKLIIPPRTQKRSDTPTLFVACMIVEGVENIPVPTIRFTINSDVEKNPSFLSVPPSNISRKTFRTLTKRHYIMLTFRNDKMLLLGGWIQYRLIFGVIPGMSSMLDPIVVLLVYLNWALKDDRGIQRAHCASSRN